MKLWIQVAAIVCCLFVVVSSYHTVKHEHKHHKALKKVVHPTVKPHGPVPPKKAVVHPTVKPHGPVPPKKATVPPFETEMTRRVTAPPPSPQQPRDTAAQQAQTTQAPTATTTPRSTCPTCNPTPYSLTEDQATTKFAQQVPSIWGQSITLTTLATNFVSLLKTLATDSNSDNVKMSIATTFAINNFIPYLGQEPDACFMAEMINATISCVVDYSETALQAALTKLKDKFINDINPRLERTMSLSAGCDFRCGEFPPDPKVSKVVCYENGFNYPIRTIWPLLRGSVSESLQMEVYDLYDSTNFNDRFLAACATFALLEAPRKVFSYWNKNYVAERMDLVLSSSIQQDCCYQRVKRIKAIHRFTDADVMTSVDSTKQYYAGRCVAPPATTEAPPAEP